MPNLDELMGKLKGDGIRGPDGVVVPAGKRVIKIEKLEKPKNKNYGGKRNNSGRKPLEEDQKRKSIKQAWEEFSNEDVEIKQIDKGTKEVRVVKMKRLRSVQEATYNAAIEGDVSAQKEFNDRVGGKPAQPIRGEGEDDAPIKLHVDNLEDILRKAYGN